MTGRLMVGDRVAHGVSGMTGWVLITIDLDNDLLGDLAGQWASVQFDDGFRCWCPAAGLQGRVVAA